MTKPACQPGCSHCCTIHVEVRGAEALALAEYLGHKTSTAELEVIKADVAAAHAKVSSLPRERRGDASVRCPLLGPTGCCTVYEMRPMTCRSFNSRSAANCEVVFKTPGTSQRINVVRERMAVAGEAVLELEGLAAKAGKDNRPYDLFGALHEALSDLPGAQLRWQRGEQLFSDAALY